MAKKELTKKQLKKQLTTLTEDKGERSESALKKDLKKSFDALKQLDRVTTGQKIGDVTITKSMNKKIKNAKRYIEDLYDTITDGEIEKKEQKEGEMVGSENEQSEGYGKMPNEMEVVVGENVVKVSQKKLNSIIERVIVERKKQLSEDSEGEETYNYGEDEGGDKKEEMSMEDHVKAIEDHLKYLKKDMGYDEDHEDRDEEDTDFRESRKPRKRMAESRKVKRSRRK